MKNFFVRLDRWWYVVIIFIIGGIGGYLFQPRSQLFCLGSYEFLNKDVVCGEPDVIKKTAYAGTKEILERYTTVSKEEQIIQEISIYFRDLIHGPVMGINEHEDFSPASLLKLPLAFVFLAQSEVEPELLSHTIKYTGETSVLKQRVQPSRSAKSGEVYTIEQLVEMMILYSDNASYEALEAFLKATPERGLLRTEIFRELGLISPIDQIQETVTTRGYASLFRILFNASYLTPDHSEKLLSWLAHTEYDKGIVSGVPPHIPVAHKFGERYLSENIKQLHDCGIIYYPGNPYLLCVMTRGSDFNELETVIQNVSRIVYEEVDSRRIR